MKHSPLGITALWLNLLLLGCLLATLFAGCGLVLLGSRFERSNRPGLTQPAKRAVDVNWRTI